MRKGYEVHQAFLEANQEKIARGEECLFQVKDLSSFVAENVRAIVSPGREEGADWVDLWIKNYQDKWVETPWKIKVLKVMDLDEIEVARPQGESEEEPVIYGTAATTRKILKDTEELQRFGFKKKKDE
jgi:hypothetical protein